MALTGDKECWIASLLYILVLYAGALANDFIFFFVEQDMQKLKVKELKLMWRE